MNRVLSLIITILAVSTLACNSIIKLPISSLKTIPTETFSIDEPLPAGEAITKANFAMAASSGTLTLAGGAEGIVEAQIRFNVAEWKPIYSIDNGTLLIEQSLPGGTIGSTPEKSINDWEIRLGNELLNIKIECPAGDLTLYLTESIPDSAHIRIEMGRGNLRLVTPSGAAARVDINSGTVSVSNEGAWVSNGNTYTTSGGSPTWNIELEMGAGKLTLANE